MAKSSFSGLGKGLDALFGDSASFSAPTGNQNGVTMLPIAKVQADSKQPRKAFDSESLQDLADSIAEHGIIQPITVRKLSSGYYQIIAGERRWRAARLAQLSEVPVLVIEADDRTAMELALIENLQREDLNPIEEAQGYRTLMDEYGLTQEQAAARVGKSRSNVANILRLLHLDEHVRNMIIDGSLSVGHARALLSLGEKEQCSVAEDIKNKHLTVRQTESLVKKLMRHDEEDDNTLDPSHVNVNVDYVSEAERELSDVFSRRCRIIYGKKKGKIEFEYYGTDDLNDLIDVLKSLR